MSALATKQAELAELIEARDFFEAKTTEAVLAFNEASERLAAEAAGASQMLLNDLVETYSATRMAVQAAREAWIQYRDLVEETEADIARTLAPESSTGLSEEIGDNVVLCSCGWGFVEVTAPNALTLANEHLDQFATASIRSLHKITVDNGTF